MCPACSADATADSRGDYPRIRGQSDTLSRHPRGEHVPVQRMAARSFTLERIEVLRGRHRSSMANLDGRFANWSRTPQAVASNEIGVHMAASIAAVQLDSTGKLTKDGEWLYRFIGVFRDSNSQPTTFPMTVSCWRRPLTWRPTTTPADSARHYRRTKTGSSTAFLPHEGTLFHGANGLIPVRDCQRPSSRYQTERPRSAPVRAQLQRCVENNRQNVVMPTSRASTGRCIRI